MNIDQYINQLRKRGLRIEKVAFQGGYSVIKPKGVGGNIIKGYSRDLLGSNLEVIESVDSPISYFYEKNEKWYFLIDDSYLNDKEKECDTYVECLQKIEEYYFDDPVQMKKLEEILKKVKGGLGEPGVKP